jgi:Ser/Thr protein kinase RdoA (MazF antagonist)
MPIPAPSLTAEARARANGGDLAGAGEIIARLLREKFALEARDIRINVDIYSLNSLNGFFMADGKPFFFKFHQEENEEAMAGEYYRAGLLAEAGLPVDQPLHVSTEPGEQILVYRRREDRRFADVLKALDFSNDQAATARAVAAERQLNEDLMAVYRRTLHPITAAQSAAEPIHRLFQARLVDAERPGVIGGRFGSFYRDQVFALSGETLTWGELQHLTFEVNGVRYRDSLGALFAEAFARLEPTRLADSGGVTAHGDAHNANVWYEDRSDVARLSMFDPAFAGRHVPALLAEVKTTFHNIFAHPLWLYDAPAAAEAFTANAKRIGDVLHIETDWRPSAVRLALLQAKRDLLWKPLLAELAARRLLPADWRRVVQLALFLCPTLVMNLRAGGGSHNTVSSAIGLSTAIAMGSNPVAGTGLLSAFFSGLTPDSPNFR